MTDKRKIKRHFLVACVPLVYMQETQSSGHLTTSSWTPILNSTANEEDLRKKKEEMFKIVRKDTGKKAIAYTDPRFKPEPHHIEGGFGAVVSFVLFPKKGRKEEKHNLDEWMCA